MAWGEIIVQAIFELIAAWFEKPAEQFIQEHRFLEHFLKIFLTLFIFVGIPFLVIVTWMVFTHPPGR